MTPASPSDSSFRNAAFTCIPIFTVAGSTSTIWEVTRQPSSISTISTRYGFILSYAAGASWITVYDTTVPFPFSFTRSIFPKLRRPHSGHTTFGFELTCQEEEPQWDEHDIATAFQRSTRDHESDGPRPFPEEARQGLRILSSNLPPVLHLDRHGAGPEIEYDVNLPVFLVLPVVRLWRVLLRREVRKSEGVIEYERLHRETEPRWVRKEPFMELPGDRVSEAAIPQVELLGPPDSLRPAPGVKLRGG